MSGTVNWTVGNQVSVNWTAASSVSVNWTSPAPASVNWTVGSPSAIAWAVGSSTSIAWTVAWSVYVTGPASAVDADIAVFDGASGKRIADSGYSVADVLEGRQVSAVAASGGLSALRACIVEDGVASYASSSNAGHANRIVGVSLTAADAGAPVSLRTAGALTDASWSWDASKLVFCGESGHLTQTPPSSGFSQPVAVATAAATIEIGIRTATLLA